MPVANTKAIKYLKGTFSKRDISLSKYNTNVFEATLSTNENPYKSIKCTNRLFERSFWRQVQYLLRLYVTKEPQRKERNFAVISLGIVAINVSGKILSNR